MPVDRKPRAVASPLGRLLLINLLVFAAGLIAVELVFGNWLRPNRMGRLNVQRDVERSFLVDGLYPSTTGVSTYRRDAFGFRGVYPSQDAIDILTVGGSTTDQKMLSEGETWQDILAAEFRREAKQVSVVNGGVDGQSTYGHIKNFDWWYPQVAGMKVGYFLFYVGANDFYKDEGYDYDRLVKPRGLISIVEPNSVVYHVFSVLRGLRKAYYVARRGRERLDFDAMRWTTEGRLDGYDALMRTRLAAYRQRLEILVRKVHEQGAKAICVTQPSRRYRVSSDLMEGVEQTWLYDQVEFNGVDHYYMLRRLNRLTLQTCKEMSSIGIDLAQAVQWEDEDFYDFFHNTPQGARKIGVYLHRQLRHLF